MTQAAIREYYELAAQSGKFNMSAEQVKKEAAEGKIYLVDIARNDATKSFLLQRKYPIR